MIELYRLKKKKKGEAFMENVRKGKEKKKKPSKTKIGQLCPLVRKEPPLLWEAARKGGAGRSFAKVKII